MRIIFALLAFLFSAPVFAQTAVNLPIHVPAGVWVDLGAGPIEVLVVSRGVSLATFAACPASGGPGSGSVAWRAADRPLPFYTTLHVCAHGGTTGGQVVTYPIGATD